MARALPQHDATGERGTRRFAVIHGSGGGPPGRARQPPIENVQLALLIFIAFETMVFVGLVTAYYVLRSSQLAWPPPDMPRLPLAVTLVNTAMLTFSAFTMWRGTVAARGASQAGLRGALVATTVLGLAFLAVQGSEWVRLI